MYKLSDKTLKIRASQITSSQGFRTESFVFIFKHPIHHSKLMVSSETGNEVSPRLSKKML